MNYSEYNPFRGGFRVTKSEPGSHARGRAVFIDSQRKQGTREKMRLN